MKPYIELSKTGILYGNAITALGGFFLASKGTISISLLIAMLIGISCIVASSCVLNNIIDKDIDRLMERTKRRVLARDALSIHYAYIYAFLVGIVGLYILGAYTNPLTLSLSIIGFICYVGVYSLWAKRNTEHAALIGGIAGAVPPMVGYCAVTNEIDGAAVIIFFVLCAWQMPHFFAIAIRRAEQYAQANIPVFPLRRGVAKTKIQMLVYTLIFSVCIFALWYFKYVGTTYLILEGIFCTAWIALCIRGLYIQDEKETQVWAKKVFSLSLIGILLFSTLIGFGNALP
jgi:heme o synthase